MGSIEEERLAQMVHDFMESESSPLPISSNFQPIKQQPKSLILKVFFYSASFETSFSFSTVLLVVLIMCLCVLVREYLRV